MLMRCPHFVSCAYIAGQSLSFTGPWNARSATVLGQRGAWIFSTQGATHSELTSTTTGVSVSRISNGDVLDLNTYQITPAGECHFYLICV